MIDVERVDFVSLPTEQIDKARRFYGEVIGLEVETVGSNGLEFRAGQLTLALVEPSVTTGVALRVPDVTVARAQLEAQGVEFDGPTADTGVCHVAFFRDPDGNALMLHRRYAP